MTYEEAEQRLKELLLTGFFVNVNRDEDLSFEVDKLLFKLFEWDNKLFNVSESFEYGAFDNSAEDVSSWTAGVWSLFGVSARGETLIVDRPPENEVIISFDKFEEIVESLAEGKSSADIPKFEAVSGDQSLFDLVGATDEHLYIVRNAKHTGIYAATQAQWDKHNYLNKVLAERKVKEPEFIPYHTEDYPHEDCKGGVMAFRSRSGETAINFEEECGRGEVVLSFENTIKFANELLAIANGVERKE